MAAADKLRGQLMRHGYSVIIKTPIHPMIASPDQPQRFQGYHID
jgi:hypothetical protein